MKKHTSRRAFFLLGTIVSLTGFFMLLNPFQASADPGFGDIVIYVDDELGNPVLGATFTFACTGGSDYAVFDGGGDDADSEENGVIHILQPKVAGSSSGCVNNADFINDTITKEGYISEDTTLVNYFTPPTDSWNEATVALDFTLVIDLIENEIGDDIMPVSGTPWVASDGLTMIEQTYDSEKWYLAATGTGNLALMLDGYVQSNIQAEPDELGPQQTISDFFDVPFAIKVSLVNAANNAALSGGSVVLGDDFGVTCSEDGITGMYYCAAPVDHTATSVRSTRNDFHVKNGTYIDRTLISDDQTLITLAMTPLPNSGGGGGGGGGTTGGATGFAPTNPPVVPAVPLQPPVTENSKTDIVSVIDREADLVSAQSNPERYFIDTGTDSTLKLGAGERAAAISSFKEAYGKNPITKTDWIDVLNIANGRWPITVNKEVEARAYINFRTVYGRNADMKNSTDVNALKMMGYGVRSKMPRNLSTEINAIVRFKSIFGFNPTTARHWNIMRAIAYSGVE